MSRAKKKDRLEGTVVEWLPNMQFRVKTKDREEPYLCYLAGRLKLARIRLVIGDRVQFVYPPGSSVGRIEWRYELDDKNNHAFM